MQLEPKPYLFQIESTGVHIPHPCLAGVIPRCDSIALHIGANGEYP